MKSKFATTKLRIVYLINNFGMFKNVSGTTLDIKHVITSESGYILEMFVVTYLKTVVIRISENQDNFVSCFLWV